MTDKAMYFGNAEYMTWVPAPTIDLPMAGVGWNASGEFLDGGAYVQRSANKHKTYQFNWSMETLDDLTLVKDFDDGLYGDGPFYFLLPGTFKNVLPQSWATPRLAVKDAPLLADGPKPTLRAYSAGSYRFPTGAAIYTLDDPDSKRAVLTIPVPPGYYLHLGVHGGFTGTSAMAYSTDNGSTWTNITPMNQYATVQANTTIAGKAMVQLSLRGTGTATIRAMVAQISQSGVPEKGPFRSGQGHSGVEFSEGGMQISMYSAVKDLYSGSATMVEVGQWR